MKYLLFLAALFFWMQCAHEHSAPSNDNTSTIPKTMKETPITYRYADGNGNSYVITPTTFAYHPIKKEMSSSGEYDGGEPVKKEINEADFKVLEEKFSIAMEDTASHINKRQMGSGRLSVVEGEKRSVYLFAFRSRHKTDIEAQLRKIKSPPMEEEK